MGRRRITSIWSSEPPVPPATLSFDDVAVTGVVSLPDGSYIICGFNPDVAANAWDVDSTYKGNSYRHLFKILNDGTFDPSFSVGAGFSLASGTYLGNSSRPMSKMVYDSVGGRIIVVGDFANFDGVPTQNGVIALNLDGTQDTTFNSGGAGYVYTGTPTLTPDAIIDVLPTSDGGLVLVGFAGKSATYNGTALGSVFKVNSDGSVASFASGGDVGAFSNNSDRVLIALPSDRIGITGSWQQYGGSNSLGIFHCFDQSGSIQWKIDVNQVLEDGIYLNSGVLISSANMEYRSFPPMVVQNGLLIFQNRLAKPGWPDFYRKLVAFNAATGVFDSQWPNKLVAAEYMDSAATSSNTYASLLPLGSSNVGVVCKATGLGNSDYTVNGDVTTYRFAAFAAAALLTAQLVPRNNLVTGLQGFGWSVDVNGKTLFFGYRMNAGQLVTEYTGLIRLNADGIMENVF